ncbi:MAG: FAD:protein FMN transferase [Campylobacterota bacterium]|nr:FAD:protein FMN transferase [Campylobacterota bacterium]
MLEVYKFNCFTAPCEVQLYCNDKTKADNCAKDILMEAKRVEAKYNYFDQNSYLSTLNKRATNILDTETKTLLTRAKQYYKRTNRTFDITSATLKDIYNLSSINEIEKQKEYLSNYTGCEHFEIKKDKLYFDNQYTKIDLGGFVKEYAVDKVQSIIKRYKIKSALVNFGGDIFALGKKPDKQKFIIAITNPSQKDKTLFTIAIEDQALTTSASYERFKIIEDKKFSHIISKDENNNDILSATVVSNSCVESGVYSTSLMCDKNIKTNSEKYLINSSLEILR